MPTSASAVPRSEAATDRVVVIATPQTVGAIAWQAGTLPSPPIGWVQVGGAAPARAEVVRLGSIEDLPSILRAQRVTLAIVTLPAAMTEVIRRVRGTLRQAGVGERFVPPLEELLRREPPYMVGLAGEAPSLASPGASRVDLADLMGRAPASVDREAIAQILRGKRVLITGAGGSIGSELARLAADFEPEQVQLMERSENALFEIDAQLARRQPGVSRRAVLHDVVDPDQTLRLLVELRPHVVFHAAAHKHVPLMEDHPSHAVTNNLFGTKSIADASVAVEAERFVMVSTDKAVNPRSVMGATKRLAELYVQSLRGASLRRPGGTSPTRLSMVRFGNVIGSSCSVLTIWSAQLAEGGPLTVTDPRMTRYFMTIPEAAALVLQAGALDSGPDDGAGVFVLDMDEPILITDLARRFARAHGFEPVERGETLPGPGSLPRVELVYTGARPGEKIHEELAYAAEHLRPTRFPRVNAWIGASDTTNPSAMIADLSRVRQASDRASVVDAIRRHVPEWAGG